MSKAPNYPDIPKNLATITKSYDPRDGAVGFNGRARIAYEDRDRYLKGPRRQ